MTEMFYRFVVVVQPETLVTGVVSRVCSRFLRGSSLCPSNHYVHPIAAPPLPVAFLARVPFRIVDNITALQH